MARREVWIGSFGPYEFDDEDLYHDGVPHQAVRIIDTGLAAVGVGPSGAEVRGSYEYQKAVRPDEPEVLSYHSILVDHSTTSSVRSLEGHTVANHDAGTQTLLFGTIGMVENANTGTITEARGLQGQVYMGGAGQIDKAIGVNSIIQAAAGTMVDTFGFFVDTIGGQNRHGYYANVSGGTNNYSFFSKRGVTHLEAAAASDIVFQTLYQGETHVSMSIQADGRIEWGYDEVTRALVNLEYVEGTDGEGAGIRFNMGDTYFYHEDDHELHIETRAKEPTIHFDRARVGAGGAPAAVQDGDFVGGDGFFAYDGVNATYTQRAFIGARVEGAVSSGNVPMALYFYTGSSAMAERLRIDPEGAVRFTQISEPSTTTDRLYNVAGDLKWNGDVIAGPGTAVDADTLDGLDSTDFAVLAENETIAGAWTFNGAVTVVNDIRLDDTSLTAHSRFVVQKNGQNTWRWLYTGQNEGYDLELYAYDPENSGALLGTVFTVDHSSRVVNFAATPTVGGTAVSLVGHTHPASDIVSGTFDNARISESSVTQHQAALSIAASQVTAGTFGAGTFKVTQTNASAAFIVETVTSGTASLRVEDATGGLTVLRADGGVSFMDSGHFVIGHTTNVGTHDAGTKALEIVSDGGNTATLLLSDDEVDGATCALSGGANLGFYGITVNNIGAGTNLPFHINVGGSLRMEVATSGVVNFTSTPTVNGTNVSVAGHTHAASEITAGTFGSGNYVFQGSVTLPNDTWLKGKTSVGADYNLIRASAANDTEINFIDFLYFKDGANVAGFFDTSHQLNLNRGLHVGDGSTADAGLITVQTNNSSLSGLQYILNDGSTIRGYVRWDDNEDLNLFGDQIIFERSGGTTAMVIDTTGHVVIGHSQTVGSHAAGSRAFEVVAETAGENATLLLADRNSNPSTFAVAGGATLGYWALTSASISTGSDLPFRINVGGSDRMFFLTNGDIGVGGSPSTPFHLVRTGASAQLRVETITSGTASLDVRDATGGRILLRADTGDSFVNAGHFVVGHTAVRGSYGAGERALEIIADTADASAFIAAYDNTSNPSGILIGGGNTLGFVEIVATRIGTGSFLPLKIFAGGAEAMNITTGQVVEVSSLLVGGKTVVRHYEQSGAPGSPNAGDTWYDTDNGDIRKWIDTTASWELLN